MAPHHTPDADSSETAPASDQPAHAQEPAREQETDEPRTAYERRGGPVQQRAIRIIGPGENMDLPMSQKAPGAMATMRPPGLSSLR